jgi:hypothetical protein
MWLKKLFLRSAPKSALPAPAITPAMIAEAKKRPNGWLYAIDGVADSYGDVPPERIRGAWKVNANGEIEGDFIANPNYRPIDGTA